MAIVSEELKQELGSPLRAVESLALRGRWATTTPETELACPGLSPKIHRLAAAVGKSVTEASSVNVLL